ncbi:hypothetical protein EG028_27650 [Chitinophaga barathri]|uniref:DUF6644 domain-containing protein n=2 Tax=Chitinophaga barathri TaxID=1647451 RepID=A0A3N4ME05_9BACT|nr:hypothetical protein EG028_27650 [Chitinophaga barathri]
MEVADWLQALEQSVPAAAIRQSAWLYPFLEIVHITGIVLLVGPALMFDLRLLGFSKHLPIAGLGRHLLTWSVRGLWLVVPSGILLFITNAATLGYDPVFWAKMILLVLAAGNALLFRVFRPTGENGTGLPPVTKVIAVLSLVLWTAIIACGRLLAY